MPPASFEEFDWFGRPPDKRADRSSQQKMAVNILDSYSRSTDLLAEALQNATDAIDLASEQREDAKRRILIDFNAKKRTFSVTDTGIGMSQRDLKLALGPNLTFKDGELAPPRRLRARGEKGVGLTFMAVACNRLVIRTCDGKHQYEAVIEGANDWARAEGAIPPPKAKIRQLRPRPVLGSSTYTVVTVSGVEMSHFETDLFKTSLNDLVWILRTDTAIGNTAPLFSEIGHPQPEPIGVDLTFTPRVGEHREVPIPYRYLSPEEFLRPNQIVDFDDVKAVDDPFLRRRQLRGKALRYVHRHESASGRKVSVYALVMDGREMRRVFKARKNRKELVPPEDGWQGFKLATRNMPAGVNLGPGVLPTRTWERRVLMVLEYDDLSLDLGRKTIAVQTRRMLNLAVKTEWQGQFGRLAQLIAPSPLLDEEAGDAALKSKIERALAAPKLEAPIPYMRRPSTVQALTAVFHELLGAGDAHLPSFHPLMVRVFSEEDALIYPKSPNGGRPLHVVFAMDARAVVEQFDQEEQFARTADLAVVWEINADEVADLGLTVKEARKGNDGATHSLSLGGTGGREDIRLLELGSLVED